VGRQQSFFRNSNSGFATGYRNGYRRGNIIYESEIEKGVLLQEFIKAYAELDYILRESKS